MDWPSFFWGLAVVPALAVACAAGLAIAGLIQRSRIGTKCDHCDWQFAGRRAIFECRDYDDDSSLRAPMNIVAFCSGFWHDQVIRRTPSHRQSWTEHFESLTPGGSLRASRLRWAKRNGMKGHQHLA